MPQKIITAREILAQKEQVTAKFDANGFINQVGRFFLKHNSWDVIYVKPVVFAKHKKLVETWNITKGWLYIRDYHDSDKYSDIFSLKDEIDLMLAFFRDFDSGQISVDEPFIKNAITALQVIAGYVVKYDRKKKAYRVSLT